MKKLKLITLLILGFLMIHSFGQVINKAEYFIDFDPGVDNGMPITFSPGTNVIGSISLETHGLRVGNHMLYVRTEDDDGIWSIAKQLPFYVKDTNSTSIELKSWPIVAAEFFIDVDPGVGNGNMIPVERNSEQLKNFSFPTTGLNLGEHKVYVRVKNERGIWTNSESFTFAVMPTDSVYPTPLFRADTVPPGTATSFTNLSYNVTAETEYKWDVDGDGTFDYFTKNIQHAFSKAGYYEVKLVTINDSLEESFIGTVVVGDFSTNQITVNGNSVICQGDSVEISAPSNYSYEWNTGDTAQSIWVKNSGRYYTWLTDSDGLSIQSTSVSITVKDTVNYSIITFNEATGAFNGSAQLDIKNYRISELTYNWSNGINGQSYLNDLDAGNYSVTVSNGVCDQTSSFLIDSYIADSSDLVSAEYFWDTDPGAGNGTSINVSGGTLFSHELIVSTTGLNIGNHKLYFRTKATNNIWSIFKAADVYIKDTTDSNTVNEDVSIIAAEYFVDTDPGIGNGTSIPVSSPVKSLLESITLNASDYTAGNHVLYIRVKATNNIWSNYETQEFQVCGLLPSSPISEDVSVCYGDDINLSATGSLNNTFRWFNADSLLIDGENNSTFDLNDVIQDAVYYVAQVDAAGCQSSLTAINISVKNIEMYAGLDETLSKAGNPYIFNYYFPDHGLWTGSGVSEEGLLERSDLNEGIYELTYTIDSLDCNFTDTKTVAIADLSYDYEITINENPENGLILDTIELQDIISYSIISGDSVAIFINETGLINVMDSSIFDFEENESLSWVIYAVEDEKTIHQINFEVNLVNQADPPLIESQEFAIDENSTNGTVVGTIEVEDSDSPTLLLNIRNGNDSSTFIINALNQLVINDSTLLDYEIDSIIQLEVSVTDGLFTRTAMIKVMLYDVDDMNHAPEVYDQVFTLLKNSPAGIHIDTIIASDVDGDPLLFSIQNDSTNIFILDSTTGILSVNDTSSLYQQTNDTIRLKVSVTDGMDSTLANVYIILISVSIPENHAPELNDQVFTIAENSMNGTIIGTVLSSDADGDALSYSIISGNTSQAFYLDNLSGELTVNDSTLLDYETTDTFNLDVIVSDGMDTTEASIIINITDVLEIINHIPDITDQLFTINENSSNGTIVGNIIAIDIDDDPLIFSLSSINHNSPFALDTNTGVLSVSDSVQLDYETSDTFYVYVIVTDGIDYIGAIITIVLNDVTELPTGNNPPIILSQIFEIFENSPENALVGTIAVSDPDNDSLTFSIISGNMDNVFAVDPVSGAITVAIDSALDYEVNSSYTLIVEVSDGQLNDIDSIFIHLIDVVEEPVNIEISSEYELYVYPNPVSEFVLVEMNKPAETGILELFNLTGQKVLFQELNYSSKIYLNGFEKGIYIYHIIINNEKFTGKLIVK